MDELISVIVPVYKVEKYLRRCLDSIKNQTYQNLEVILVDDGSPDNCPQICDEYAAKDSRFHVIHKENGGLSSARNAGLAYCTKNRGGGYIAFVDSDDYIAPNMYEKLLNKLYETNADICGCNINLVDEKGVIKEEHKYDIECSLSREEALRLVSGMYGKGIIRSCWNQIYKKEIFKDIRFPEGKTYEDAIIQPYVIDRINVMSAIPEALYYYVQRDGSIMHSKASIKNLDRVEVEIEKSKYFLKIGWNKEALFCLYHGIIWLLKLQCELPKHNKAIQHRIRDLRESILAQYQRIPRKYESKPMKLFFFIFSKNMILSTLMYRIIHLCKRAVQILKEKKL